MDKSIRFLLLSIILIVLASCSASKLGREAMLSHDIGEYYQAIEKYRKASRKEKDRDKRREYAYAIANCYNYIGDYEMAALYYRNALRRGYEDPVVIFKYAEMLRASQDYEEAVENYRTDISRFYSRR